MAEQCARMNEYSLMSFYGQLASCETPEKKLMSYSVSTGQFFATI